MQALADKVLPVLNRVYSHLPYIPSCGWDKTASLKQPKSVALNKPYIEINPPTHLYWLVFDLDHSDCFIWEDKLPTPNLIVKSRDSGRSHVCYAIEPVCTTDNGLQHPKDYAKAVWHGLAIALEADELYTGRITKNPFCDDWHVIALHNYEYSLGELADSVTLPTKGTESSTELLSKDSRHWAMFDHLRFWAYPRVRSFRQSNTYEVWYDTLLRLARNCNSFTDNPKGPLKASCIKAAVKSVARWTWNKYTGSAIHRGIMALAHSDIPLESKQRLAARRTHQVRRESTEKKIRAAINNLRACGRRVTKAAVARIAQVSRQLVSSSYQHLFAETESVQHGVHKVTVPMNEKTGYDKNNQDETKGQLMNRLDDEYLQTAVAGERSDAGVLDPLNTPATFKQLCTHLVVMPRSDGLAPAFDYKARGRIAKVLLKEKVTVSEALDVAVELSMRSSAPEYHGMKVSQWVGYALGVLRRMREHRSDDNTVKW